MSIQSFLIVYGISLATMLICRCAPIFLLKGRELPEGVASALNLIPPAAFAALVANDLFNPATIALGPWNAIMPLIAAALVCFVAVKTKSLIWCALAGVVAYAILSLV